MIQKKLSVKENIKTMTQNETDETVRKLTHKMLVCGFVAVFQKIEEGPVLRTFYFKPAPGALFSKILNKEEEIAGTLAAESVRLMREGGLLVIEVPRQDRQMIRFDSCLHELLTSEATKDMQLPLLMGQTPRGDYLYCDLADQPHMLIAGATGGGKSVFTSMLIASLALVKPPSELSFTLTDTKSLDLVFFEDLAHVSAVVRTAAELRTSLSSALGEIRRRNALMSGVARNIKEWNAMGTGQKLKYKIFIVDELADVLDQDALNMQGIKKIDRPTSIPDLLKMMAQIGRAAGIHMIAATQRPSVKVMAGDIKTNFPARIAFKLPTMQDSRVILDENGAENLLGKGDYLYKISGSDMVRRAHSAYVSMTDIAMITNQHSEIRRMYARPTLDHRR